MTLKDFADTSTLILAIVAAVSAGIAVWGVFENRRSKTADTIAWCMKTFYEIQGLTPSSVTDHAAAKNYFERLWGLQFIEYHFYKLKLIPESLFVEWLWARHQEYFGKIGKVGSMTYEDGWKEVQKTHISDANFTAFIKDILDNAADQRDEIRTKVRKRFRSRG